jgi:tRNA(Leu) C34 or U34 (ribose-2'-O)-methylase TrmL
MLVKPMKGGVTATVLMDCCHSGTVLDLPYKFAATDRHMRREEGFNMDVVTEPIRKEKVSEADAREAKKQRQKAAKEKEKADERRAQRAEDNYMVGPKLAPNGQPVLPTRPAAHHHNAHEKHNRDALDEQAPPPAPPGQCCIII